MKRMVCEICGGTDLIKQDGLFVCQNCLSKYSVEEAKKIMIEVDGPIEIKGTVRIEKNASNLLKMGDDAYSNGNAKEAYDYYTQYLEQFPDDYEVKQKRYVVYCWNLTLNDVGKIDVLLKNIDPYCSAVLNSDLDKTSKVKKIDGCFFHFFESNVLLYNLAHKTYIRNKVSASSHQSYLSITESIVQKQIAGCEKMINYLEYVVPVRISGNINNIKIELNSYGSEYRNGETTFFLSEFGKRKKEELLAKINTIEMEISKKNEEIQANLQKERNKQYWDEHKELKQSLLEERLALSNENEDLIQKIKELNKLINDVKVSHYFDGNAYDKEMQICSEEIKFRTREFNSLNIFQTAKKREIDRKIRELEEKQKQLAIKKKEAKIAFEKERFELYRSDFSQARELEQKLNYNNFRIKAIDNQLNANY